MLFRVFCRAEWTIFQNFGTEEKFYLMQDRIEWESSRHALNEKVKPTHSCCTSDEEDSLLASDTEPRNVRVKRLRRVITMQRRSVWVLIRRVIVPKSIKQSYQMINIISMPAL